jgi:hypothetical protein
MKQHNLETQADYFVPIELLQGLEEAFPLAA